MNSGNRKENWLPRCVNIGIYGNYIFRIPIRNNAIYMYIINCSNGFYKNFNAVYFYMLYIRSEISILKPFNVKILKS